MNIWIMGKTQVVMKKKLGNLAFLLALTLSVSPVMADQLTDLCAERDQVLQKILSSAGTDQADQYVSRFKDLTIQIDALFKQKVSSNTQQLNNLNNSLQKAVQQRQEMMNVLFSTQNASPSTVLYPANNNTASNSPDPNSGSGTSNLPSTTSNHNLSASISAINYQVDKLVDLAVVNNVNVKLANEAVAHYSTKLQKLVMEGKDLFNYLIPYRGFMPSSEAADIILDEKIKLKSLSAAQYQQQKLIDEAHLSLMVNIFQLAMTGDPTNLKAQIGDSPTSTVIAVLDQYKNQAVANSVWDIQTRQDKLKLILKTAIEKDETIKEIVEKLHKYNQHSSLSRFMSHAIPIILGVVGLAPDMAGPAAKGAMVSYLMVTGGQEQDKLVKEVYLDKRLESRVNLLSEEAHLALEGIQLGRSTNNPALYNVSMSLIEQMTDPETLNKVME